MEQEKTFEGRPLQEDRRLLFNALGFKWDSVHFPPLEKPDKERALFRLSKLFPELVFDIVHLEGNAYTFPEIQTLLEGITVGGRSVSDTQQALNQKNSLNLMIQLAKNNAFSLTKDTFCSFNEVAAKDEAIEAGKFRTSGVGIGGTEWKPPSAELLDDLFIRGISELSKISNPFEKSIAFFLFGARTQFFFDGNKRTSRLMMNSILLEAGQDVITVPAKFRNEFNTKMVHFYNYGDASEIMSFMANLQIKSRFEP